MSKNKKEILKQQIDAIDRFLADNPEFEKLSAGLSQFNVFRALKIEKMEIRHSNVLSWLLDPDESHGLSDVILRRVLSNMLLLSDINIPGLSAARVELLDFTDVEVLREWRNIDILVVDRGNRIILLFENKIHSNESQGQLMKYLELVKKEYPDFTIAPIFLTLTGQEVRDVEAIKHFICYSHVQMYSVLNDIFQQRKDQLATPIQVFFRHYLETLRRLTMQDSDLKDLCKTIYRKHREAIDLIIEYGKVSAFQQAAEDVLKEYGGMEILYSSSGSIWFMPKSWTQLIPDNGLMWSSLTRPVSVCCWFEYWKNKIYSHFEICKMEDKDLRIDLVKSLSEAGFNLRQQAFEAEATYSRFYGKTSKVKDETDYDENYSVVKSLLIKAKEEFPKAEAVFRNVFGK